MAVRLWCIRHGEVEAPYVGTFVGSTDIGLSEVGQHQAQALAGFLADAGIDVVLTSPRQRARLTAAPLCDAQGLEPTAVPALAEMEFGAWEGLHWPAIEALDPAFAARWQEDPTDLPCPGGESAGGFAQRVKEGLEHLLAEHDGKTVALFAHAGVNRAILAAATGMDYMDTFAFAQDYGSASALHWEHGRGQVALWNVVPGPFSEANGDGGRRIEERRS